MTPKEKRRYREWKKAMRKNKLPRTDSIDELARFWESHDLTDFEDELEEVSQTVFERRKTIHIQLPPHDADTVRKLAKAKGMSAQELVVSWIMQHLTGKNGTGPKKRSRHVKNRK